MARNEIRPIVKLRSSAGTGYTYVTRKNRRNTPSSMHGLRRCINLANLPRRPSAR